MKIKTAFMSMILISFLTLAFIPQSEAKTTSGKSPGTELVVSGNYIFATVNSICKTDDSADALTQAVAINVIETIGSAYSETFNYSTANWVNAPKPSIESLTKSETMLSSNYSPVNLSKPPNSKKVVYFYQLQKLIRPQNYIAGRVNKAPTNKA